MTSPIQGRLVRPGSVDVEAGAARTARAKLGDGFELLDARAGVKGVCTLRIERLSRRIISGKEAIQGNIRRASVIGEGLLP